MVMREGNLTLESVGSRQKTSAAMKLSDRHMGGNETARNVMVIALKPLPANGNVGALYWISLKK
jgi:hypothetical protein